MVSSLYLVGALFGSLAAADEVCLLPVDVMILQDTTGSFVDDLPNVSKNIPTIVEKVTQQNPGSYFGACEHKDKPYRDLGEPNDFCYRLAAPLSGNTTEFQSAYDTLYASGGGDLPEAQLHALINLATDPNVAWRTLADKSEFNGKIQISDKTGARLIILSTDAVYHDPEDYNLYNGVWFPEDMPEPPTPPQTMPTFPDSVNGISVSNQCTVYDYPSPAQAAALLKAADIHVVFLVPETETEAVTKWKEFNTKYMEQPESFVQYIKSDSSDVVEVILKALAEVSDYVCNATTTTEEPTTAPATTTTTTTTPAPTTTTTTTTTPAPTTTTTTTTTTPAPTTTTTTTTTPAPTTTTTTTTPAPTTTTTTTTPAPTTTTTTTTPAPTTTTTTTTPAPTTTTTTTTPAPTTTTTTTTPAPTTTTPDQEVTTAGTPETTATQTCQCDCPQKPCQCACPEVVIKLRHRPNKMHFDLENEA